MGPPFKYYVHLGCWCSQGAGDPAASPAAQADDLGPDLRDEIPMDMGSDEEAMDTSEAQEPASSPAQQAKEEVKTEETPKNPKDVDMKQWVVYMQQAFRLQSLLVPACAICN